MRTLQILLKRCGYRSRSKVRTGLPPRQKGHTPTLTASSSEGCRSTTISLENSFNSWNPRVGRTPTTQCSVATPMTSISFSFTGMYGAEGSGYRRDPAATIDVFSGLLTSRPSTTQPGFYLFYSADRDARRKGEHEGLSLEDIANRGRCNPLAATSYLVVFICGPLSCVDPRWDEVLLQIHGLTFLPVSVLWQVATRYMQRDPRSPRQFKHLHRTTNFTFILS